MSNNASLASIFTPQSIAIVGASEEPGRVGADTVRALRENGYRGAVYPVNPKYEAIFGFRAYPSLESIDAEIEVVVIAIPAAAVRAVIETCVARSVHYAIVLSGGF